MEGGGDRRRRGGGGDAIRRRHPSQSIPLHFMPCLTRPHMNRPQTSHQRAVKLSVLK